METWTLRGPDGIKLVLDKTEIVPHDPGAGTPAMVYFDNYSATFNCATDTGELTYDGRRWSVDAETYFLTNQQLAWLRNREDDVWTFLGEEN